MHSEEASFGEMEEVLSQSQVDSDIPLWVQGKNTRKTDREGTNILQ